MPIPKEELQTRWAGEARALAEAFESSFGKTKVALSWRPEMRAPDVQSTAGGVQAAMPVVLTPSVGPAFVLGHAHAKERKAELRTFEHANRLHRQRYDVSIAILPQDYDAFLTTIEAFFTGHGLQVRRVGPPSLPPPSIPPPAAKRWAPIIASAIIVVVMTLVYVLVRK